MLYVRFLFGLTAWELEFVMLITNHERLNFEERTTGSSYKVQSPAQKECILGLASFTFHAL